MPDVPLANLQLGRVARSSQQMPAIGPFANDRFQRCNQLAIDAQRALNTLTGAGSRWFSQAKNWRA
jgi:hypothetical protein